MRATSQRDYADSPLWQACVLVKRRDRPHRSADHPHRQLSLLGHPALSLLEISLVSSPSISSVAFPYQWFNCHHPDFSAARFDHYLFSVVHQRFDCRSNPPRWMSCFVCCSTESTNFALQRYSIYCYSSFDGAQVQLVPHLHLANRLPVFRQDSVSVAVEFDFTDLCPKPWHSIVARFVHVAIQHCFKALPSYSHYSVNFGLVDWRAVGPDFVTGFEL